MLVARQDRPDLPGVDDTALVLVAINGLDLHNEGRIAVPFGWDATPTAAGLLYDFS